MLIFSQWALLRSHVSSLLVTQTRKLEQVCPRQRPTVSSLYAITPVLVLAVVSKFKTPKMGYLLPTMGRAQVQNAPE